MNPEVKTKWLEALRSGNYKQGQNYLHRGNDEFCCLGVLCDLAVQEGVVGRTFDPDVDGGGAWVYQDAEVRYSPSDALLPAPVVEWAGLDHINPEVPTPDSDGTEALSALNDTGKSFGHIAQLIEVYY